MKNNPLISVPVAAWILFLVTIMAADSFAWWAWVVWVPWLLFTTLLPFIWWWKHRKD